MQKKKKNHTKILAPLQTSKKCQGPLLAMKIVNQPHIKTCKLNFYWNICCNFFKAPLTRGILSTWNLLHVLLLKPSDVLQNGSF